MYYPEVEAGMAEGDAVVEAEAVVAVADEVMRCIVEGAEAEVGAVQCTEAARAGAIELLLAVEPAAEHVGVVEVMQ